MTNNARKYPETDAEWSQEDWQHLLEKLINEGIVTWKEATSTILGSLNPSQVGTSIATKKTFQKHYPRRKCWEAVRSWHFLQQGQCVDCGTRINLQADHAIPKEFVSTVGQEVLNSVSSIKPEDTNYTIIEITKRIKSLLVQHNYIDIAEELVTSIASDLYYTLKNGVTHPKELEGVADRLDNMVLRCRRHNVIRRPSHAKGGQTFLTAEAGLMWLLFVHRPNTYQEFMQLCRDYGLSMANIRFEEAWAMARWLKQSDLYNISPDCKYLT